MRFLVKLPPQGKLEGNATIVTGSGLDWKVSQILMTSLLEGAKEGVEYENATLRVLSDGEVAPKVSLTYGKRLCVDTRPYASSRFTKGYAVVVQDIRDHQNNSVGYIVALPDGQVARVVTQELLSYCEAARARGDYFLQNMQYVGPNTLKASHLKNYEGKVVPVYELPAPNKVKQPQDPTTSVESRTITIHKLVLDIDPETILNYEVKVETPHKVDGDSIQTTLNKALNLLKLKVNRLSQLTDKEEVNINNYIVFATQFPEKYALWGLTNLVKGVPLAAGYLTGVEFKEKYKAVYESFVKITKRA